MDKLSKNSDKLLSARVTRSPSRYRHTASCIHTDRQTDSQAGHHLYTDTQGHVYIETDRQTHRQAGQHLYTDTQGHVGIQTDEETDTSSFLTPNQSTEGQISFIMH